MSYLKFCKSFFLRLTESQLPEHKHSISGDTGEMSKNAIGDFQQIARSVVTVGYANTDVANYRNSVNDGNASYVFGNFSIGSDKLAQFGLNSDPPWRPDHVGVASPAMRGSLHLDVSHTHKVSLNTKNTGNGSSFSVVTPYEAAYCWKRIA